jgi:tetratricopeptide (TPR) repeat protein
MTAPFRSLLVLSLVAALAAPLLAQEDKPAAPADATQLLQRLETLYPRALRRPELDRSAADPAKARTEQARAEEEWDHAVAELARTGDEYLAALPEGTAPDPRALFYRGVGKTIRAQRPGADKGTYDAAAESLVRCLESAGEGFGYRADAEMFAGRALLGAGRSDDALSHLARAVELFQKDGRHDQAGECAVMAMKELKHQGKIPELRAFVATFQATEKDFGRSTPTVRMLAAASRLDVGSPLPDLPPTKDAEGKDVAWAPGKPLLIHFFLSGYLNGMATSFREIETEVRPLWEKYREKGLAVVGVSMDYEMPKAQVEDLKRKLDEWGVKRELRDGSLESVRKWTAKQAIEWPWCWDGKATNNPVSLALGGVGFTQPYAVLVDAKGVVRWHGEAPFKGLPDAVAKLLP